MTRATGLLLWLFLSTWGCSEKANWVAQAEQVRWRYPGLNGLWLDPHNWMGQTSGVPHVPGPTDDVVLSDFSYAYGPAYIITLEVFCVLSV